MNIKSRLLIMLECIEAHIEALRYFVHDSTIQTAIASIELEAGEACEALHEMEDKLFERFATDVDYLNWSEKISRYALMMGSHTTPDALREIFNNMAEALSRIDEEISYPSESFLKSIYAMLLKYYDKRRKRELFNRYTKWKAQHSRRLLANKLKERIESEKQTLIKNIGEESYFEVFDVENDEVDIDGVARFIMNHREQDQAPSTREGLDVSCHACYHIYRFIVMFEQLKTDLTSEEQQKKQRVRKKTTPEEPVYKYPRSLSQLPAHLQGKIIIVEDERFATLADLLNQKVLIYIRQQDNKQLWDVVKSLMQERGLLPKRFSREKFAQLIAFLCPDAGDAKKLQYCMEKNNLTKQELVQANRPFIEMLKPLF